MGLGLQHIFWGDTSIHNTCSMIYKFEFILQVLGENSLFKKSYVGRIGENRMLGSEWPPSPQGLVWGC